METASKIKEVETNPFLYQKIVTQLNRAGKDSITGVKFNLRWAVGFVVLVVLNLSVLIMYKVKSDNQVESAAIEKLSGEMFSCTIYNY